MAKTEAPFSAGDRVRVRSPIPNIDKDDRNKLVPGALGAVIEVLAGIVKVEYDAPNKVGVRTWWCMPECLEPAPKPSTKTEGEEGTMAPVTKVIKPANIARHSLQTIVLPEGMGLPMAIDSLSRRAEEDEKLVVTARSYTGWHHRDVIVQVNRAMAAVFGWVDARPNPGFFGTTPPKKMQIEVAPHLRQDFVYGVMGISAWNGTEAQLAVKDTFETAFSVAHPQKYQAQVNALMDSVEHLLETASIYKGQAIDSSFEFLPDIPTEREELIFDKPTEAAIEASILWPIREFDEYTKLGLKPSRHNLLCGPYGTGKTLTARRVAQECKGIWTFLYIRTEHTGDFASILENARRYAPAVVFIEDIDTLTTGDRTLDMNAVLNTLDGIASKGVRLMSVMTTNHPEKIHPAMRRSGRLDAFIMLDYPALEARARLLERYLRGKPVAKGLDCTAAAEFCVDASGKGYTGAEVREVAERSTLYARSQNRSLITTEDVKNAALSVQAQVNMTREPLAAAIPSLDSALRDAVSEVLQGHVTHDENVMTKKAGEKAIK